MSQRNKLKILNDPIYGFITIPNALIFDIIEHQYVQRLRRISQMGVSFLVYPGAHHTRFHHALGSMHLMAKAIRVLRFKDVEISEAEAEALQIAILLHDVGHGPFSHAMEHSIVNGITHEQISVKFMERMNAEFDGKLDLAIEIFKGKYHRKFMHQLISSQLDMDRLDYLKRDSFYTGVAEGNINSERLIAMLNVVNDELVVEMKGIYSVEKFLVARRLMYWQVYLHKTSLGAEQLMIRVLKRAKELADSNVDVLCSEPLTFFLQNKITAENFSEDTLKTFALLDDYDIISAMKQWMHHEDVVLAELCQMIINRDLLKVKLKKQDIPQERIDGYMNKVMFKHNLTKAEASYFVFKGSVKNLAYERKEQPINILHKNGKITDVVKASDQLNLKALSKTVKKYFICYPKP